MAFFQLNLAQVPSILEQIEATLIGKTPDSLTLGELHFFRGLVQFWGGDVERSLQNFEEGLAQIQRKQLQKKGL